jgi:hypothetical protein
MFGRTKDNDTVMGGADPKIDEPFSLSAKDACGFSPFDAETVAGSG